MQKIGKIFYRRKDRCSRVYQERIKMDVAEFIKRGVSAKRVLWWVSQLCYKKNQCWQFCGNFRPHLIDFQIICTERMCLYQLMACWPTSYKLYMYNCTTMEKLQFKKMPSIQTLKHWNWNSVDCSGVHVKTICYLSDNNPSAWKRKRNTCRRDGKTKTKRHSAVEIGTWEILGFSSDKSRHISPECAKNRAWQTVESELLSDKNPPKAQPIP